MTTEHFPQDIPADAQAFMDRLKSEVIPRIERLTVPFFHLMKDPRTNEYGIAGKDRSGILLRIGDEHFILTAAHFIQDYVDRGIFIFMSWDDEENCPIPVTGDQIALTDQSSIDVAAIKLLPETATKLLKRHSALTLTDIERNCRSSQGMYLILGYPRAGTEFIEQKWDDPQGRITMSLP